MDEKETEEGVDRREWISDEALESVKLNRALHPEESLAEATRRVFRENSPIAAQAIAHIAIHDPNTRVRLDAAKYVVERVLGKPGEENPHGRTPLDALMEGIVTEVEEYANKGKTEAAQGDGDVNE
jgi:hypothetical protein